MHTEPLQFIADIKRKHPKFFNGVRVLECGSRNINGSPRQFFVNSTYVGVDLTAGAGIDVICPCHQHDGDYDVVVSTEMLEHDKNALLSLAKMQSNLVKGGLMIFSSGGPTRLEHGTTKRLPKDSPATNDHYRNLDFADVLSVIDPSNWLTYSLTYARASADLLFYGIKKTS